MKKRSTIAKHPNFGKKIAAVTTAAFVMGVLAIGCGDDDGDADTAGTPQGTATSSASAERTPTSTAATGTTGATGATGSPSATGSTGAANVEAEVEEAVNDLIEAYNGQDAEAFFGMMSDEGAESFLGYFGLDTTDLEAAKQEAAPFIGEDPLEIQELNVTDSSEDSATVEMIAASTGILEGDLLELTKDGDEWTVSDLQLFAVSPEVPSGYETYDMALNEFSFTIDGQVASGQAAFATANEGEQPHEALLAKLDPELNLEEALMSEEQPEGLEVIGGVFGVEPGDSYNLVYTEPLEAGRYVFVCFLPDLTEGPEGTPHAFKGMVQEFNIE